MIPSLEIKGLKSQVDSIVEYSDVEDERLDELVEETKGNIEEMSRILNKHNK